MKRKHEDGLARLAFGDVSPAESLELEQLAAKDPEMARRLSEYRSMRDGLRELADVPAHQLSNERLKEAILGQGLRAKPNSTLDLSWLWMSGVACALVAALFVGLGRGRSAEPQLLIDSGRAGAVAFGTVPDKPFDHPLPNLVSPSTRVHQAVAKQMSTSNALSLAVNRTRHHRSRKSFDDSELLAAVLTDQTEGSPPPTVQPAMSVPPDGQADTGSEAIAKLKPVDDKPDSGVVEIESEKDPVTGTQKATELGSTTNVVFGG